MRKSEIKELKEKRNRLLAQARKIDNILYSEGEDYYNFFNSQTCPDFKLYKLPSIDKFKLYQEFYDNFDIYGYRHTEHPLEWSDNPTINFGKFDYQELAVLLKMIFQYETDKEYDIVTTADLKTVLDIPTMHYVVGEKNRLESLKKRFNGQFMKLNDAVDLAKPTEGIIDLSQTANSMGDYKLDRDNMTIKISGSRKAYFNKYESIFKPYLNNIKYRSHRDLLRLPIHIKDEFITKILYSIMIYKLANQKQSLNDADYNEIIRVLYNDTNIENVTDQVKKDIPKELVLNDFDDDPDLFRPQAKYFI